MKWIEDSLGGPATELATTGAPVNVGNSAPPAPGMVPIASSPTAAEWGYPPSVGGLTVDATIRTSSFTAARNTTHYVSNVSGGDKTVTLPASPADGDRVEIISIGSNNYRVTINPNGHEIVYGIGLIGSGTPLTFHMRSFHLLVEYRAADAGGFDGWQQIGDEVVTRFGDAGAPLADAVLVTDGAGAPSTIAMSPNTVLGRFGGDLQDIAISSLVSEGRRYIDVQACTVEALPAYSKAGVIYTADDDGALNVDGFSPAADDLILVVFEEAQADTGVFRVLDPGSAFTPWQIELIYQKGWTDEHHGFDIFRVRQGNTFDGQEFTYGEDGVRPRMIHQPLRTNPLNIGGEQTIRLFKTHYVVSNADLTLAMLNFELGVIPGPKFAVKIAGGATAEITVPGGVHIEDPWSGVVSSSVELFGQGAYVEWEGRSNGEGGVIFYVVPSHTPLAQIIQPQPGISYISGDFDASPNAIYLVEGPGETIVVTLPAVVDAENRGPITIKRMGGTAEVEVMPVSPEQIDRANSVILTEDAQSITVVATSTEWVITATVGGALAEPEEPEEPEPPTPSGMLLGANTWFLSQAGGGGGWAGEAAFIDGINWSTAIGDFSAGLATSDFWNPAWIDQIAPYTYVRMMDWGQTNFSAVVEWADRRAPTASQYEQYSSYDSLPGGADGGMSYEWMIDLANRHNKDLWICVPHQADDTYITNLATMLHDKLEPGRKVYIEYSNETWNFRAAVEGGGIDSTEPHTSFTGGNPNAQLDYTVLEGTALSLPGANIYYQGGAYSVYRSLQIFALFEDVFGSEDMGTRVVRVVSASGNLDILNEALSNIYESGTYNPDDQTIDLLCSAPYLWGDMDGASLSQSAMEDEVDDYFTAGDPAMLYTIKNFATTYSIENWGCYEGGQQSMTNADLAAASVAVMKPAYRYMLDTLAAEGCYAFSQYTHTSDWQEPRAWGAVKTTDQDIGTPGTWTDGSDRAPKYEALWEFWQDNIE